MFRLIERIMNNYDWDDIAFFGFIFCIGFGAVVFIGVGGLAVFFNEVYPQLVKFGLVNWPPGYVIP